MEMLPELLKTLTPLITCNSAFCMLPKKRVLHLLQNLRGMIRSGVEAFALTVAILIVQAEWQKAAWHGNECQS